jgi:hypothetical protein
MQAFRLHFRRRSEIETQLIGQIERRRKDPQVAANREPGAKAKLMQKYFHAIRLGIIHREPALAQAGVAS